MTRTLADDTRTINGWRITIRRGKHRGFVGHASHAATYRTLDTFEHRGKGARDRAIRDVMVQIEVDDILREERP